MIPALMLAAAMAAPEVPTADWPQWRGPNRDGKAGEQSLLQDWPAGGPKLAWENREVGTGYGSPAVVGGKMYLLGGDGSKAGDVENLLCLDATTGKQIWKTPVGTNPAKFLDGWGGGPRSTPTVSGEFVFVLAATGDLACLKAADGSKVWTKNLLTDFGGSMPTWGYSESPLVDGANVVVTPGKKTGMVALKMATGETAWECKEFGDVAGYSSIVVTEVGGVRQYVQQTMASAVGVAAADGKLLWKGGKMGRSVAVIPTPVVAEGYAFFTTGYGGGCECFKLAPDGRGTKADHLYKSNALSNHHGGVVQVGDHVYGHSDRGGWTCLPFKAEKPEPAWQAQKFGKGSVSFAGGLLYCYAEDSGELVRLKPTPEAWTEAGRMKIPAKSKTRPGSGAVWAHPVIAGGKLFLRDYELLYCFDVAGK